jgi:hypothetical protein
MHLRRVIDVSGSANFLPKLTKNDIARLATVRLGCPIIEIRKHNSMNADKNIATEYLDGICT